MPKPMTYENQSDQDAKASEEHASILELLTSQVMSLDDLIDALGLGLERTAEVLLDLELRGSIVTVAGGYQRIS